MITLDFFSKNTTLIVILIDKMKLYVKYKWRS